MTYRPNSFLIAWPFIAANAFYLFVILGSDIDFLSIKSSITWIFLNIVGFVSSRNVMNTFEVNDKFLVVTNDWRINYEHRIQLSEIKSAYSKKLLYDSSILLFLKNDDTLEFSTMGLSKQTTELLVVRLNSLK